MSFGIRGFLSHFPKSKLEVSVTSLFLGLIISQKGAFVTEILLFFYLSIYFRSLGEDILR